MLRFKLEVKGLEPEGQVLCLGLLSSEYSMNLLALLQLSEFSACYSPLSEKLLLAALCLIFAEFAKGFT